mgnify:CR=1 FL=1
MHAHTHTLIPPSSPQCTRAPSPYFYHIAAAPGSGEYALRHLLAPGAWAHSPLHKRLLELQVGLRAGGLVGWWAGAVVGRRAGGP